MYRQILVMAFIKFVVLSLAFTFSEGKPRWNLQEIRKKSTQNVDRLSSVLLHSRTRRQVVQPALKPSTSNNVLLLTKSSWFLAIEDNGKVVGKHDASDANIKLEMQSVGSSLVRFYGLKAKRYLAMNAKGHLYTTTKASKKDAVFRNTLTPVMFHTFSSVAHRSKKSRWMYVAIRKNGLPKRGDKTNKNNRSTLFSVIHV